MKKTTGLRSRRGMALLVVLGSLVFISGMMVAFMGSVKTELQTSAAYASSTGAKQLSESCVNVVMAQIREATKGVDENGRASAWSSQPGMIRTFDSSVGKLSNAYKLYSSNKMVVSNFSLSEEVSGFSSWEDQPALFTDLNQPVNGNYPILDPSAVDSNPTQGMAASQTVDQFAISGAPPSKNNQAPMPVRWLYMLQSGQLVAPEGQGDRVVISGATSENPIIGRIAFWTDDESCKVNINTASEGKYYDHLAGVTKQESDMAFSPPMKNEFNRFIGHPFMVSLSPIFGGFFGNPQFNSDTLSLDDQNYLKSIFKIIPRAVLGGSNFGTRRLPNTLISMPTEDATTRISPDGDRLYASVDELMFSPDINGNQRSQNKGPTGAELSKTMMERIKFFVTAQSRSPEVNLFNQPRVTIWPVDDETQANPSVPLDYLSSAYLANSPQRPNYDQRSPFDKLIAFCSTLNKSRYYFTRNDPLSSTNDFTARNKELYDYLQKFLETDIPGFGGNFKKKYAQDYVQILTEIYDYIRCVNAIDGSATMDGTVPIIAPSNSSYGQSLSIKPDGPVNFLYSYTRPPYYSTPSNPYFYEEMGASHNAATRIDSGWPGQGNTGQVIPFLHPTNGTRGLGRFPVLSQIAIMVMAVGANQPPMTAAGGINFQHPWRLDANGGVNSWVANQSWDNRPYPHANARNYTAAYGPPRAAETGAGFNYSATDWKYTPATGVFSTGGASTMLNDDNYGYLFPAPAATGSGGYFNNATYVAHTNAGVPLNQTTHPGFDLRLPKYATRLNAIMLFDFQNVCPGFPISTGDGGDFRIRIKGLDAFTADGTTFGFSPDATMCQGNGYNIHGRISSNLVSWNNCIVAPMGGGPRYLDRNFPNVTTNRRFVAAFPFFGALTLGANSGFSGGAGGATVGSPQGPVVNGATFAFSGGIITVELHRPGLTNDLGASTLLQTYTIQFPAANFPTPRLASLPPATALPVGGSPDRFRPLMETCRLANAAGIAASNWADHARLAFTRVYTTGLGGSYCVDDDCLWNFFLPHGGDSATSNAQGKETCDVIKAMQLSHGDFRLISGLRNVPSTMFTPHPTYSALVADQTSFGYAALYNSNLSFSSHTFRSTNGYVYRGAGISGGPNAVNSDRRSIQTAGVNAISLFKTTSTAAANNYQTGNYCLLWDKGGNWHNPLLGTGVNPSNSLLNWSQGGDYDVAPGTEAREGAFINVPDLGTLFTDGADAPYIYKAWVGTSVTADYFSPNKILPSAVMFGSLPTGVNASRPWQTLVFSPNPLAAESHYSFQSKPRDHLLLDLFQMPVVDPYPISEPFSTAGKINMNYQIMPFTYIKRDMALRAVLKPYRVTAIRDQDVSTLKTKNGTPTTLPNVNWRYKIDATETLKAFEDRFSQGDIFRSASEICDIYLVPEGSKYTSIKDFWTDKKLTGDNYRERPYVGIYSHLTTKSNTYTVHYRVQTLIKPKNDPNPNQWHEGRDQVLSEYRGSTLLERYIDANDSTLPDYATAKNPKPLDNYYRFRVLQSKQFNPG